VIARCARQAGVRKLVFTSSNCLWASNLGHPVREDDPPAPAEVYGESKLAAEKLLRQFEDGLEVVVLRCPTIIDSGRLGLLAILFEFIRENKTVWVVVRAATTTSSSTPAIWRRPAFCLSATMARPPSMWAATMYLVFVSVMRQ